MVHRVGGALATLWAISLLVFIGMHVVPGGYGQMALALGSTRAQQEHLDKTLGLTDPVPQQYVVWVTGFFRGNMGLSLTSQQPVWKLLAERWPVTVELALLSLLVALLIGVPLGLLAGVPDVPAPVRFIASAAGPLGIAVPDFVLASILLYLFSKYSLGLPVGQYEALSAGILKNVRSMALGILTLGIGASSIILRSTRSATIQVLSEPYLAAAVTRGEGRLAIVRRHVARNIAVPLTTVTGTILGYLFGGAVVVETVFSIPGLGSLLLESVEHRDYPVVQSAVMLAAAAFIGVSLLVDLGYGVLDPRIRLGHGR